MSDKPKPHELPVATCPECGYCFGPVSRMDFDGATAILFDCPVCDTRTGFENPWK